MSGDVRVANAPVSAVQHARWCDCAECCAWRRVLMRMRDRASSRVEDPTPAGTRGVNSGVAANAGNAPLRSPPEPSGCLAEKLEPENLRGLAC